MDIKQKFPQMMDMIHPFVKTCHDMYRNHYVCSYDGNISVRFDNLVLATPTHLSKGDITADDLIVVNLKGDKVFGHRAPTSELKVHLAIYNTNKEARAVVHGHPIYTTAIYRDGKYPDSSVLTESQDTFKNIPVVPNREPGTTQLAEDVAKAMGCVSQACVMEKHGAVTCGKTLEEAYFLLESLERLAKTEYLIASLK